MRAIYPGTFDPVTNGHLDIIQRTTQIFSEVIVAVAANPHKPPLFTVKERKEMLQEATRNYPGIEIDSFEGLVIEFAKKKNIMILIRGMRMFSDFEYEFQMALTNRRLNQQIETIFLMPSEGNSFISSRLLKEAASLGADISSFVPQFVEWKLKERIKNAHPGAGYTL